MGFIYFCDSLGWVGLAQDGSPITPSPRGALSRVLLCRVGPGWQQARAPGSAEAAGQGSRQECQECGAAVSFPLLFLPPPPAQNRIFPVQGNPSPVPLWENHGAPGGHCSCTGTGVQHRGALRDGGIGCCCGGCRGLWGWLCVGSAHLRAYYVLRASCELTHSVSHQPWELLLCRSGN